MSMNLLQTFSNIIHKIDVRVANNKNLANGYKEANRERTNINGLVANGSAVNYIVAPWSGFVESMDISGNATSTSTSGSSVTVSIVDVTKSNTVIASFDTYIYGTEIKTNAGFKVTFAPGISGGVAVAEFAQGDVLAVKAAVNGTARWLF